MVKTMFLTCRNLLKILRVIDTHPEYAKSFLNYTTGNCYYNGKISNGALLGEFENQETGNLDNLVFKTKLVGTSLYLFHGFEAGIKYNDWE